MYSFKAACIESQDLMQSWSACAQAMKGSVEQRLACIVRLCGTIYTLICGAIQYYV